MNKAVSGHYVSVNTDDGACRAFVPAPLPPRPTVRLDDADWDLMERANRALGRLDGLAAVLPDASLFTYFYVRKEAVLSSQIEGTQSSVSDLLLYEAEGTPRVPLDDVREVTNYVGAMDHALRRIRKDNFPISCRLLREAHDILLRDGRGSRRAPGQFRKTQNWIGGTTPNDAMYVPPPANEVPGCMQALEDYLHDKQGRTPLLLKSAFAHAQFESIHPFLDGNGRVGRLLITLLLCAEGALQDPLLYISLYFRRNRSEYYERLQRVRTHGEWEQWLRFFLRAVTETAQQATQTAKGILALFDEDRKMVEGLGRRAGSAVRVLLWLQNQPVTTVSAAARGTGLSAPTVRGIMVLLESRGILRELTGFERDRIYSYRRYVDLLETGTEARK